MIEPAHHLVLHGGVAKLLDLDGDVTVGQGEEVLGDQGAGRGQLEAQLAVI